MLRPLVEHRTREAIYLTNRVVIEVHTASFRAVRGYTVVGCIADEIAFWRSEESANPDTEILRTAAGAVHALRRRNEHPVLLGLGSVRCDGAVATASVALT